MSAAHLEQMFLAPRDFLKLNLLCMVGPLPQLGGLHHFSYELVPGLLCQRRPGFLAKERYPTRIWYVRLVPRSARNGVPAFFLPCLPGQVTRAMLPRDAQFMLATTAPGAIFGAARHRYGPVEVCHAHYQGPADAARSARETAAYGARLMCQAPRTSTVIGVNNPRQGWQFHGQIWEKPNAISCHYRDLISL